MKRLLCLISAMNAGGAETFLMKIYRALDRTKYQMDFCINVDEECFYSKEIESLGGKIYYVPPKSESVKAFRDGLTAVIRGHQYKYVLRIVANGIGFMDLKIAKKAGAEVCLVRSSNSSDGGFTKSVIIHNLGKLLYSKYIDVKLAPSDLAAEYTFGKAAYRRGDVSILHNGIDLDVYQYRTAGRASVRAALGIHEDCIVAGHIGRFVPQKNHSFLLDIFSAVHQKMQNTVLLLLGTGPLEDDIRGKVHALGLDGAVIFAGVRSDVPDVLSAMDVFLFPSLYEGMPNTVVESQAAGLPCVISDTITREADLTGLVTYMSLRASPEEWAGAVLLRAGQERTDTRDMLVRQKYDIPSVVSEFVSLAFGEKGSV